MDIVVSEICPRHPSFRMWNDIIPLAMVCVRKKQFLPGQWNGLASVEHVCSNTPTESLRTAQHMKVCAASVKQVRS